MYVIAGDRDMSGSNYGQEELFTPDAPHNVSRLPFRTCRFSPWQALSYEPPQQLQDDIAFINVLAMT